MPDVTTQTEAAAVRAIMDDLHEPRIFSHLEPFSFAAVPRGIELKSIKALMDEYLATPERRRGTAKVHDVESFIAHVNRFKGENSIIFAVRNEKAPSMTAVLDYHEPGPHEHVGARHGQHRTHYMFPLSTEWQAWAEADGKGMSHAEFAFFLEDRIGDVLMPPPDRSHPGDAHLLDTLQLLGGTLAGPSRLLELSRGLKVHEDSRVTSAQNISTGEMQVQFDTEHKDATGAPLRVPNMFLIGIPVFAESCVYRLPVRLRYRLAAGKLTWFLQRYRPEITFLDAFDNARIKVLAETGLPMIQGEPEK